MKQPTVFFGASSYVIPLIEYLNKEYDLKLVVTTEQHTSDPVPKFCLASNIPYISVTKFDETAIEQIKNICAEFAILADFRLMIRRNVLDIFPKGIINIHPSLLPEYRGPTPGLSAILNGKKESGVSLMLLDETLDHGKIVGQIKLPVLNTDTSPTLYARYFKEGTKLLEKVLPDYLEGKITPTEQDHSKATYTQFLKKESGFFDSTNPPAKEKFTQMVKAYFPWPGVWTKAKLNGKEKIIKFLPSLRHPERSEGSQQKELDSSPSVASETKKEILIQVEGKKPQSYKDFLNGYPDSKEFLQKLGLV